MDACTRRNSHRASTGDERNSHRVLMTRAPLSTLILSFSLQTMVRQMNDGERWRAIRMLNAGRSIRAVARAMGRSPETIKKLLVKTRASDSVSHASRDQHRRRLTTARADRRLIRLVRGNPSMPATLFRLMWEERNRQGIFFERTNHQAENKGNGNALSANAQAFASVSCS